MRSPGDHVLVSAALHFQLAQARLIIVLITGVTPAGSRQGVRNLEMLFDEAVMIALILAMSQAGPDSTRDQDHRANTHANTNTGLCAGGKSRRLFMFAICGRSCTAGR